MTQSGRTHWQHEIGYHPYDELRVVSLYVMARAGGYDVDAVRG
jgi:hypothetical protein